jgi:hypothetical protein
MGIHEVVVLHFVLRTCQIGAVYERVVDLLVVLCRNALTVELKIAVQVFT